MAEYEWRKEGGNLFSVSRWRFVTPVSEPLSALSPGYQPLYRNVYIFTAVPGQCLSQADPQLVTPDPVTPGRWSGRGGGCGPGDNYQRINGHFRRAGGGQTFNYSISSLIGNVLWILSWTGVCERGEMDYSKLPVDGYLTIDTGKLGN